MPNTNAYMKEYYKANRDKCLSHQKAYYLCNKHKKRAKDAVYRAVLNGTLTRPHTCTLCLNVDVEAHHEDYSKPLDVLWLCPRHHAELHRVRRFMARNEIDRATLRLIV